MSKIAVPSVVLPSSLHKPLIFFGFFLAALRAALVKSASTGIVPMVNVGSSSIYLSAMSLMEQSRNSMTRYFKIHARSFFSGQKPFGGFVVGCVVIIHQYAVHGFAFGSHAHNSFL